MLELKLYLSYTPYALHEFLSMMTENLFEKITEVHLRVNIYIKDTMVEVVHLCSFKENIFKGA